MGKSAFELELAGRFDAPASKDIAGGGSVSTSLLGLSLAPCFRASYFGLCAVGTVASLHTASEDVTSPRSERSAWFSVGARAVATIPLAGGLGLRVFTEASFSLLPYELRVGGKVVHSSSPVSGLFGIGPSFTFD